MNTNDTPFIQSNGRHMKHNKLLILLLSSLLCFVWGCPEDDPDEDLNNVNNANNQNNKNNSNNQTLDCKKACETISACQGVDVSCLSDFQSTCEASCANNPGINGLAEMSCENIPAFLDGAIPLEGTCAQINTCMPADSDYVPGQEDQWDACVSDDGTYKQFNESISSAGRVAGFEEIADLLWRKGSTPTSMDFLKAREIYATGEGLDSRVARREDEHYPPIMENGEVLKCRDEGVPEKDPNRCVGPARIRPIINAGFQAGIDGEDPVINAAKVEAALLWFLYVSTHKEAITCTAKTKDCDSAYAYYTGAQARDAGIGLAKYLRTQVPQAHERVWDGILAVRCWRDLDPEETATNLTLRDRAVDQMDKGLLYGLSQIILQRAAATKVHTGTTLKADLAWLNIMVPVLYRDAETRNPEQAASLRGSIKEDSVDADAMAKALTALYDCP